MKMKLTNMSKKGQGLAFISILVLLAILFFIFRFNTETYSFLMTTGDEQAHLVNAYVEGAKVKSYTQTAARQAAFEAVWNLSNRDKAGSALGTVCSNARFKETFTPLFQFYDTVYTPSLELIDTEIPDFTFDFKCDGSKVSIEGWGFAERCVLNQNYPIPKFPCEDQENVTACGAVQGCTWNSLLNCTETIPEPTCSAAVSQSECSSISGQYCDWRTSYSEKISVFSVPLANYQFVVESDAHFIETIIGKEYEAFAETRIVAPSCRLATMPTTLLANTPFAVEITYNDDTAPQEVTALLEIQNLNYTFKADKAGLTEIRAGPPEWRYNTTAPAIKEAGTYRGTLVCVDQDKARSESTFTVRVAQ